jgi:hypothetical protein
VVKQNLDKESFNFERLCLSRWAGASHVAAEELLLEAEGREDGSLLADLEGAGPLVPGQTFAFC